MHGEYSVSDILERMYENQLSLGNLRTSLQLC